MPIIELNKDSNDIDLVMSYMLFPDDDVVRKQFLFHKIMHSEIRGRDSSEEIKVKAGIIDSLLTAPSYSDFEKLVVKNKKVGVVVGDLLAAIYLMETFKITEPSLNKAVHIAQTYAEKYPYADGSKMSTTRSTILKYWSKFKSVAHFWAAFRLNSAYDFCPYKEVFTEPHFQLFLEVSAGLQKFFTTFKPSRTFSDAELVKPDDLYLLPDNITPRHLVSDTQPDILINALNSFRAPQSLPDD